MSDAIRLAWRKRIKYNTTHQFKYDLNVYSMVQIKRYVLSFGFDKLSL